MTHLLDQLTSRYLSEASLGPPSDSTSVLHLRCALLSMETPTTTCGTRRACSQKPVDPRGCRASKRGRDEPLPAGLGVVNWSGLAAHTALGLIEG